MWKSLLYNHRYSDSTTHVIADITDDSRREVSLSNGGRGSTAHGITCAVLQVNGHSTRVVQVIMIPENGARRTGAQIVAIYPQHLGGLVSDQNANRLDTVARSKFTSRKQQRIGFWWSGIFLRM